MIDSACFTNFAPAAERNGEVILEQLVRILSNGGSVLEIGSGSGQHAALFSNRCLNVDWYPTETELMLPGLESNLSHFRNLNLKPPGLLDLYQRCWAEADYLKTQFNAAFTANTLHIVDWSLVESLFSGCGKLIKPGGLLIVYGPIKYDGCYTSSSNEAFDLWLKQRDDRSGIREFGELDRLAEAQGMSLLDDISMPANNQILVWQKE